MTGAFPTVPRVLISPNASLEARRVTARELLAAHRALLAAAETGALQPRAAEAARRFGWRARAAARALVESTGDVEDGDDYSEPPAGR